METEFGVPYYSADEAHAFLTVALDEWNENNTVTPRGYPNIPPVSAESVAFILEFGRYYAFKIPKEQKYELAQDYVVLINKYTSETYWTGSYTNGISSGIPTFKYDMAVYFE